MSKANKLKISKKLNSHDSILKAITTFNCKNVLTVEEGTFFYWVRMYENGDCKHPANYQYFNNLDNAVEYYNKKVENLNKQGYKFNYNRVL